MRLAEKGDGDEAKNERDRKSPGEKRLIIRRHSAS